MPNGRPRRPTSKARREGWRLIRDHYDDGGFSGGSMDRPALQKLLIDVQARRIDVIVVYKVDRLVAEMSCLSRDDEITSICGDSLVADAVLKNQSAAFGADLGHASSRGYVK
jgi:site-specific DNA recombinase